MALKRAAVGGVLTIPSEVSRGVDAKFADVRVLELVVKEPVGVFLPGNGLDFNASRVIK